MLLLAALTLSGAVPAESASITAPSTAVQFQHGLDLEHTRLDNQRLRRDASPAAEAQRWLPLGSVAVGVLGALYGFWRYRDEQRRARELRVEQSMGDNLERIVDRPTGAVSNARVISALRNLAALTREPGGKTLVKDDLVEMRCRVTDTLDAIVRDELIQIQTPTDARLPVICADEWRQFEERLRADDELCLLVLARYEDALTKLRERNPTYMHSVRRQPDGQYQADRALGGTDPLLLRAVLAGYLRYLGLVAPGPPRDAAVERFREALNNKAFGDQLLLAPEGV